MKTKSKFFLLGLILLMLFPSCAIIWPFTKENVYKTPNIDEADTHFSKNVYINSNSTLSLSDFENLKFTGFTYVNATDITPFFSFNHVFEVLQSNPKKLDGISQMLHNKFNNLNIVSTNNKEIKHISNDQMDNFVVSVFQQGKPSHDELMAYLDINEEGNYIYPIVGEISNPPDAYFNHGIYDYLNITFFKIYVLNLQEILFESSYIVWTTSDIFTMKDTFLEYYKPSLEEDLKLLHPLLSH